MAKRKSGKRPRKRPPRVRARQSRAATSAAIEAALASIAHDIRTPLTGIVALAELLASSDLHTREREWANAIKTGADHVAALTSLIVDAARAKAVGIVLRHEPFAPRALADAVGTALGARARNENVKIEIAIAPDLPAMVSGDALRLRAALENLVDNATKFTEQGTVRLSAAAEPAARGRVRLNFTITDTGIGISRSELKLLFRPFAQANERISRLYGGAGLGLVLIKRVAKAMGGDLKVTSKPGSGSTFKLSVLVDRVEHRSASHHRDARAAPARSLSILCAEHNPYGRVVMNTILRALGHRIDFVETGAAAVAAVERGGYDAVLMDVALPGVDGIEATSCIRALPGKRGQVPVFGTSDRSESSNEAAARTAGMNGYFIKPVSPGKLAQALAGIK